MLCIVLCQIGCRVQHTVACVMQVVSLHCALTDETKHLINTERLNLMKKDAVLVNASRGPVIDEVALVKHLKENPNFRQDAHMSTQDCTAGLNCTALHCL